jgi:phosphoribosylamine--glycine ligase
VNVLVIGGGGREHALAWKLAQSPRVAQVFVAPGNGGTARAAELSNVPLADPDALIAFASARDVGLTVVAPKRRSRPASSIAFAPRGCASSGPTRRGGAARELEGLREGVHAAPRHSRRRLQTFTSAKDAHAYITRRVARRSS